MFINQADSEMLGITYKGEMESNIKEQKISNQGGIMAFRYAINNISQYVSQDAEEIDHAKLLKLTNITEEDLKTTLIDGIGLGISAPKIGINKRIIVVGAKRVTDKDGFATKENRKKYNL